jgi:predicted CoA-binding protein
MAEIPLKIQNFLSGTRYAVAGVSRDPKQPANAVFRKMSALGYDVYPVNPKAGEVEGVHCFPDLASVPGTLDGVIVATPPSAALDVVRECAAKGVKNVWFHRSFGAGSVSDDAVRECEARGMSAIVGGCPLMYCAPVDGGHACMRWWLKLNGRVP